MKTLFLPLFLTGAVLAGCATQDADTNNKEQHTTANTGSVALLFTRPDQPFVELGTVSTLKAQPQPRRSWQNVLQEHAAMMGADAVVIDTSTLNNNNTPMVTGTSIRYQREKPQSNGNR